MGFGRLRWGCLPQRGARRAVSNARSVLGCVRRRVHRRNRCLGPEGIGRGNGFGFLHSQRRRFLRHLGFCKEVCGFCKEWGGVDGGLGVRILAMEGKVRFSFLKNRKVDVGKVRGGGCPEAKGVVSSVIRGGGQDRRPKRLNCAGFAKSAQDNAQDNVQDNAQDNA